MLESGSTLDPAETADQKPTTEAAEAEKRACRSAAEAWEKSLESARRVARLADGLSAAIEEKDAVPVREIDDDDSLATEIGHLVRANRAR